MLVFNLACVSLPTVFWFFSVLLGKQWESSTLLITTQGCLDTGEGGEEK